MAGTLLVPDQDVPQGRGEQRVVGGQDGAAGKAEDDLRALFLEAADESLGSGELHRFLLHFSGLVGADGGWASWSSNKKPPRRLA